MKLFISLCLIVLMLSAILVGCNSGKNVSDNADGKITDNSASTSLPDTTSTTRESTRESSETTSGSTNTPRGLMTGERF